MFKQQLKAREKELSLTKVELAKKDEELEERLKEISLNYENTISFIRNDQQEKMSLMSIQHAEELEHYLETEQVIYLFMSNG